MRQRPGPPMTRGAAHCGTLGAGIDDFAGAGTRVLPHRHGGQRKISAIPLKSGAYPADSAYMSAEVGFTPALDRSSP